MCQLLKTFEEFIKFEYYDMLNENMYTHSAYDDFTKNHGKIKYPKWVRLAISEMEKEGFINSTHGNDHNYIVIWLYSLGDEKNNKEKRKKILGPIGEMLVTEYWSDLTGRAYFYTISAYIAYMISRTIIRLQKNNIKPRPIYNLVNDYFKEHATDKNSSTIRNLVEDKLETWNIKKNK